MDSTTLCGRAIHPSFAPGVQSLGDSASQAELIAEIVDEVGRSHTPQRSPPKAVSDGASAVALDRDPRTSAETAVRDSIELRVRPAEDTESLRPEEKAFQVINESRELARPMADPVYLRQLAELTADHGGGAFPPDEIDALIETIKKTPPTSGDADR